MNVRRMTVILGIVVAGAVLVLGSCTWDWNWPSSSYLTFSLEWNGQVQDVDLYVSYPNPASGDTTLSGEPTLTEPYIQPSNAGGGDLGFFPEDGRTNREIVGPTGGVVATAYAESAPAYDVDGRPAVELITDVQDGYGPEEIVVRGFPFDSSASDYNSLPSTSTGLPSGYTYAWVGVMEVYAWGYSADLSNESGSGADAVLRVYRNNELIGKYYVPTYTLVEGASLVRINCFYQHEPGYQDSEYVQILPDTRVLTTDTQIRSIGGVEQLGSTLGTR